MSKTLAQLLADRQKQFEKALETSPRFFRDVADVIRSGDMKKFRKFLRRHDIVIMEEDAESFRDYLITKRLDLKPLEPDARKRLRKATLGKYPDDDKTKDYELAMASGLPIRCRDCSFFVKPPEGEDASCVELGTKGVDEPCYAFTWDPTQMNQA